MRINIGARFVETDTRIDNYVIQENSNPPVYRPNREQNVYRRLLPSVTLAYDLTPDIVVRAAAGKTFSRPAIQSLAATYSLTSGGAGNLFLNFGNSELEPEFSTSLDGSVEWYFAKGGVLSVAGYKKTISGRSIPEPFFVPFSQLGIPSSLFTTNIQQSLAVNPEQLVELRRPVNAETYSLSGIEIAYQQQFSFLPEPFDGLGAVASLTLVRSDGLIRDFITPAITAIRTPAPGAPAVPANNLGSLELNEVPELAYQTSIYYEKGPFSIRGSYNWRDESANVPQITTQVIGLQRYNAPRGYLDANIAYKFAPWMELRIDAVNITQTRSYEFYRDVQGRFGDERSRVDSGVQNGRLITVGIRGQF
jgi:TonB-dependent receptor